MRTWLVVVVAVAVVAGPALAQYSPGAQQELDSFGPVQSDFCSVQEDCVNWEICVDGVIDTSGFSVLSARTPTKIPETVTNVKCPGLSTVCCRIPDDVWGQQQQQTVTSVAIPGQWVNVCPTVHHSCVPHYQCLDGVINTSGVGLINPRIKPSTTQAVQLTSCVSPDERYQGVPGVCCRLPDPVPLLTCPAGLACSQNSECVGQIPTGSDGLYTKCYLDTTTTELGVCCTPPEPEPLVICPTGQVCITEDVCNADPQPNTDGAGIINVRFKPTEPCYLDQTLTSVGVCCNPPVTEPVVECPGGGSHTCVTNDICQGSRLKDAYGNLLDCYLGDGVSTGVCCESPEPLAACSNDGSFFCTDVGACQGEILPDAYGADRQCYLGGTEATGICCATPAPVTSCSSDSSFFCAAPGTCLGNTLQDVYGGTLNCYFGGGTDLGDCCETPAPLTTCPGGDRPQVCVTKDNCKGAIAINNYGDEQSCNVEQGGAVGVCCNPPEPLQTCDVGYSCLTYDQCAGDQAAIDSYPDCYVTATVQGKCCEPKVPVIDTCPDQSVCLPEVLCQGEILDNTDAYQKYDALAAWTPCKLSGTGLVSPGVCCRNAAVERELPPPANKCGVRNYGLDTRIQNTANFQAQFAEFPWQAIIFFTNFTFKCGASLISDHWVLTAAHCVSGFSPSDLRVRLGEWKVDSYDEPGQYLDVNVNAIHVHPRFNKDNLHNGIALIDLTHAVEFQYHINAVCLPKAGQVFYGATRCYASGWGKDAFDGGQYQAIMKKVDLPLVPKDECQEKLRKTVLSKNFILDRSFLCAGGEEGKDACEGDGGGPLVCQDPATGRYVVSGITAWGIGCAQRDVPGVYIDVQSFRPWIDGIITGDQTLVQQHLDQQTAGGAYTGK